MAESRYWLDLSAAFDTIEYSISWRRLDDWCGVIRKSLDPFKSYLTGSCHRINLGDCLLSKLISLLECLKCQLCPLLLILYTTELSNRSQDTISLTTCTLMIVSCMRPLHHASFTSGDTAAALNGLQLCLASLQSWMSMNKRKLNPYKTEYLLIRNERQWSKYLYVNNLRVLVSKLTQQTLLWILG